MEGLKELAKDFGTLAVLALTALRLRLAGAGRWLRDHWVAANEHQRFIYATAVGLAFALLLSTCGHAQGQTYAPLQRSHTGLWYDPGQVQQGFDVATYTAGDGTARAQVLFYAGHGTSAGWYWSDIPLNPRGVANAPLYSSNAVFGQGNTYADNPQRGTLSVTPGSDCDHLDFTVTVYDAGTLQYQTLRLTQPNPSAQCLTCPAVDFSPSQPGCG